ncbi:hypothetical protein PAAG_11820 [Paracoccidioides lutzii Pb01]|uniref:Uncharacterized protein n=1 Tax=Paracoccidioides lutzii (strain ATCC MYA-826 / Pb01) TaxID=502779 RepID=A0A0A2V5P8_PARBA|nr:hypothetical protein PAAG_11820 [Paracoccidioides lutzii Pb01]KGQ01470.1 hypothetical protein PAAG_11820 [Paracoccidioides lutzii Pb01]
MNVSGTGYVLCKWRRDHPYSCAYNISDYASTINNNDQPAWMELGCKERKEKDILRASLARHSEAAKLLVIKKKIPALEKQIPPLEKQLDIRISIPGPTHLTLSSCSDPSYCNWFIKEESHLSVLILAWSYILSARWADLMPWSPVLEYTDSQAQWKDDQPADRDSVMVEIGNVDDNEARWWAAILAPGVGGSLLSL